MHKEIQPSTVFKSSAPTSAATSATSSTLLHISGQTPVDVDGKNVGIGNVFLQTQQVLKNFSAILAEAGATPNDVCSLTVYLLRREDLSVIMDARHQLFCHPFPATTVVVVSGLANPNWLVEISSTAAF